MLTTSPAEFRSTVEAYGITRSSLGEALNVSSGAVNAWFSGKYTIPPGVLREVDELVERSEALIASLVNHYSNESHPVMKVYDTSPDLWRAFPQYEPLPASWYRVIAARVKMQVPRLHIEY